MTVICTFRPYGLALATSSDTTGRLSKFSGNGSISGWASHPTDPQQALAIQCYIDAPRDKPGLALFFETKTRAADGQFEVKVPDYLGDDRPHTIYAYALINQEYRLLDGSPLSFQFRKKPAVTLRIDHPRAGQTVTGSTLTIRYRVLGHSDEARHVHWRLDEQSEIMDRQANGTFLIPGLTPGPHVLHGYIAKSHHDKVINTDVSVSFSKGKS